MFYSDPLSFKEYRAKLKNELRGSVKEIWTMLEQSSMQLNPNRSFSISDYEIEASNSEAETVWMIPYHVDNEPQFFWVHEYIGRTSPIEHHVRMGAHCCGLAPETYGKAARWLLEQNRSAMVSWVRYMDFGGGGVGPGFSCDLTQFISPDRIRVHVNLVVRLATGFTAALATRGFKTLPLNGYRVPVKSPKSVPENLKNYVHVY